MALGAAGCGGTADRVTYTQGQQSGRITGILRMIGGPAPGRRLLRHSAIRVYSDGDLIASTTTDARGRFDVVLPAGGYRLRLGNGGELLPRHVYVTAGATAQVHLTLDVK